MKNAWGPTEWLGSTHGQMGSLMSLALIQNMLTADASALLWDIMIDLHAFLIRR